MPQVLVGSMYDENIKQKKLLELSMKKINSTKYVSTYRRKQENLRLSVAYLLETSKRTYINNCLFIGSGCVNQFRKNQ